jgi:hypothetical protein
MSIFGVETGSTSSLQDGGWGPPKAERVEQTDDGRQTTEDGRRAIEEG